MPAQFKQLNLEFDSHLDILEGMFNKQLILGRELGFINSTTLTVNIDHEMIAAHNSIKNSKNSFDPNLVKYPWMKSADITLDKVYSDKADQLKLIEYLSLQKSIQDTMDSFRKAENNYQTYRDRLGKDIDKEVKKTLETKPVHAELGPKLDEIKTQLDSLAQQKSDADKERKRLSSEKAIIQQSPVFKELNAVKISIKNNNLALKKVTPDSEMYKSLSEKRDSLEGEEKKLSAECNTLNNKLKINSQQTTRLESVTHEFDVKMFNLQKNIVLQAVKANPTINPTIAAMQADNEAGLKYADNDKNRYEKSSQYGYMGPHNALMSDFSKSLQERVTFTPAEQQEFNKQLKHHEASAKLDSKYATYLINSKNITKSDVLKRDISSLREMYLEKEMKQQHFKAMLPDYISKYVDDKSFYIKSKNIFSSTEDAIIKLCNYLEKEHKSSPEKVVNKIQKRLEKLGISLSLTEVKDIYTAATGLPAPNNDSPNLTPTDKSTLPTHFKFSTIDADDETENIQAMIAKAEASLEKIGIRIFYMKLDSIKESLSDIISPQIDTATQKLDSYDTRDSLIDEINQSFDNFCKELSSDLSLNQIESKLNKFIIKTEEHIQLKCSNLEKENVSSSQVNNKIDFVNKYKTAIDSLRSKSTEFIEKDDVCVIPSSPRCN